MNKKECMKRYLLASVCIFVCAFGMEQKETDKDSRAHMLSSHSDVFLGSENDACYMSRVRNNDNVYTLHTFDKKTHRGLHTQKIRRLTRGMMGEDACVFHADKIYYPSDYAGKVVVHDCKTREDVLLEFGRMNFVTSMAMTKAGLLYVYKQAYNTWYDEREKVHHYPDSYHVLECYDTTQGKVLAEHFNLNNNSPGNPHVFFSDQRVVGEQTCFLDEHRNTLHFFDKDMFQEMLLTTAPWPINSLVKNVVKGNNLYYLGGRKIDGKAPVDCPTNIMRYNVDTHTADELVEFKENHADHLAVNDEQSVLAYSTQLFSKEMPHGFLAAVNLNTLQTIWKKNIRDYDLYVGALHGLIHAKAIAHLYVMEHHKPHNLVTLDVQTGKEIARESLKKSADPVLTHAYLLGLLDGKPIIYKSK